MQKHILIGELLVKSGLVAKKQIEEALKIQEKSKKRIGEILMELGYINSHDLVRMLSKQSAIPFVELEPEMLDAELIKSFPEDILYHYNIIPLYEIHDKVHIAIGDPTNCDVIEKLKNFTTKDIELSGAEPQRIEKLLDKFFLIDQTKDVFDE
jgi:type IV pilus assembly protein PilB